MTSANPYERAAGLYDDAASLYGGMANPQLGGAQGGYGPAELAAQVQGSMNEFINPFYEQVYNTSMRQLTDARDNSINSAGAAASAAGAFGGSRHGIVEGQIYGDFADSAGQLGAQLNAQNFQQALQAAFQSAGLGQNAAQIDQSRSVMGARGLTELGQGYYNVGNDIADRQMQAGGQQQQLLQAVLSGANNDFSNFVQQPYQAIDILNAILSSSPRNNNITSTGESEVERGLLSQIGLAAQGGGALLTGIGSL